MTKNNYCLVFYHIPKTAGMTFTDVLEKQYGKKHSFHLRGAQKFEDMETYKNMSKSEKMSIDVITGHLSHIMETDIPKKVRYVTFLRDPLQQFISSYNYIKQTEHNPHHSAVKDLDIDGYLKWQVDKKQDSNYARFLGDALPYFRREFGYDPDMQKPKEAKEVIEKAKKRLEDIEFVFITEEFDEALLVMQKKLKWKKLPVYGARKNTSKGKQKLDKETIDKIKKIHRYDFELYDMAKKRHAKAIEEMGKNFNLKKKIFLNLNNLNSKLKK